MRIVEVYFIIANNCLFLYFINSASIVPSLKIEEFCWFKISSVRNGRIHCECEKLLRCEIWCYGSSLAYIVSLNALCEKMNHRFWIKQKYLAVFICLSSQNIVKCLQWMARHSAPFVEIIIMNATIYKKRRKQQLAECLSSVPCCFSGLVLAHRCL